MSGKRNRLYLERKEWFAEHPWRFGFKQIIEGPPHFKSGLIKPDIRREA